MTALLSEQEIAAKLKKLPLEWSAISGTQLARVYTFEDFTKAAACVQRIAKVSEMHKHHPDLELSYGKVGVMLTTHSAGGLTSKDFQLAHAIEKVA